MGGSFLFFKYISLPLKRLYPLEPLNYIFFVSLFTLIRKNPEKKPDIGSYY
jgi:hypothetical protein